MPFEVNNVWGFLSVLAMALVPTVPAVLAYLQARRAAAKTNETHLAIKAVEDATNGIQAKLIETTRQAALAAGIAQGKALEKARADAETLARQAMEKED